jgi:mono/diheme cytochrome c family protein
MKLVHPCVAALLVGLSAVSFAVGDDARLDATTFREQVQPLLAKHCSACHRGEKPKGNLDLDRLSLDLADQRTRDQWQLISKRVAASEMPPKSKPRPAAAEIDLLTKWIDSPVAAAEAAARAAQGRVVLRRLNRTEYENTINDLLGIKVNLKAQLPADGSADGFDNAGAAHHTSSFLMEKYLEAADIALNAAITNRPKAPPGADKRYSIKDGHPIRGTTEDVYRFLPDGEVVCFCSSEWHNVSASTFYPPDAGEYRFRISSSAIQSDGKPVTYRLTTSNSRLNGTDGLISYVDAQPDKPSVFEFVRYMEPRTTIRMLPYGLAGANTVNKVGGEKWDGPGLAIQYVDVEGPLNEIWPPESHRRIFGEMAQKKFPIYNFSDRVEVVSDEPLADAERILTAFTRRAFRRTVTADDVAPFVAIVKSKLDGGYTFELAIRAALKGILISPDFLFLRERTGKLDDFALACRLSYFLWSSMPDEELLRLAEQGKLVAVGGTESVSDGEKDKTTALNSVTLAPSHTGTGSVLHQQVERLLNDPKAEQFTINFVGQWLNLREIDATEPSHLVYPEFDHLLKVSMIRETELFFEEILKHDLSLTNFVASDFAMLNGRLAKHYGITSDSSPRPSGERGGGEGMWEFHKTPLPPDSHRGGVLTMASVLKVTANGTTTSPVLRGSWVLDRILGTPPPPPPGDVPVIDPDIRGATTIREQLAKHRSLESCGVCHRTIDPPGFALESFDVIGGWREKYRFAGWRRDAEELTINGRKLYLDLKVDPSDVMPDGQRFENIDQFKQLLLEDKPKLARALTTKLLTYATGRAPQTSDRAVVEAIVTKTAEKDYGLRSLIHEIVQSDTFRNK